MPTACCCVPLSPPSSPLVFTVFQMVTVIYLDRPSLFLPLFFSEGCGRIVKNRTCPTERPPPPTTCVTKTPPRTRAHMADGAQTAANRVMHAASGRGRRFSLTYLPSRLSLVRLRAATVPCTYLPTATRAKCHIKKTRRL